MEMRPLGELITILSTELSIPPGKVFASMRDCASSNSVAMHTLEIVYIVSSHARHWLLQSYD